MGSSWLGGWRVGGKVFVNLVYWIYLLYAAVFPFLDIFLNQLAGNAGWFE